MFSFFGVLFNLLLLGFYKYAAFAVETLNAFLPFTLNAPSPALPLGISFFTFTNLSYLSDVYHRRAPAQKNPLDFCLYVSFFPKMISGPIVEYAHIAPQLKEHPVTLDKVSDAVPMLVLGLAKKVLLADNLGAAFQSISALSSGSLSGGSAWLGAIFYSLQLYFDFSGYSDMAIGMAKLFGFDFEANFDHPYLSGSLTEFWRRWHISLGRWFRDYVYIPLGGSRVSTAKCVRNLLIVWILTGLWHGASWTFAAWGLYHGILLLLEKYPLKGVLEKTPSPHPSYPDAACGHHWLGAFLLPRLFLGALLSWPDVRSRKPRVLGFHRKILLCGQLEAPFDWHSWLRPVDPNALSASRILAARPRSCPFRIAAGRHFPALRSVYDERHLSILPLCPVLSEVIP